MSTIAEIERDEPRTFERPHLVNVHALQRLSSARLKESAIEGLYVVRLVSVQVFDYYGEPCKGNETCRCH